MNLTFRGVGEDRALFETIAWHKDIWYATNIQIALALEISAEGC